MARVCAFPERLPRLLHHTMAWACRARASTGSIHHIFNKAGVQHMLTKRDLQALRGVPTLLIWGRHERIFQEHHKAFFTRHLPAQTSVLSVDEDDFGHVPFLDDVDRLVAILESFFRERCLSVCTNVNS